MSGQFRSSSTQFFPSIAIVGAMTGRSGDKTPTQGERLADNLLQEGWPVVSFSSVSNRYLRLIDIVYKSLTYGNKIDIFCLQVFSGRSFVVEDIVSQIARLEGKKLIMVLRGGDLPKFVAKYQGWTKSVFARADKIVSPSAYLQQELKLYGIETEIIPNVINIESYIYHHRNQVKPLILWMRAFHEIYNPLMAVKVMKLVLGSYPDARLVMAGQDMGLEDETKALARDLGVYEAIEFPGFLNTSRKHDYLSRCNIFINTNRIDNTPVSLIEASAYGLPIVATNVGGIPYIFEDRQNALLVPHDDIEEMAKAIRLLLGDSMLVSLLSQNGRRFAEKYAWEHVYPLWFDLLHSLTR